METNGRPIKLRCSSCAAEFYTTLTMDRIKDAPCPNCKERKLEISNEPSPKDEAIPIRD